MTNLYFVRHGQTNANQARIFQGQIDTPLNDTGRAQVLGAKQKVQELNIKWDVVITSPLLRAVETAEILNSLYPDIEIIKDPLAIERCFGKGDGVPITSENYAKIMRCEFEGEESEQEIISRANYFLNKVLAKYKNKNVLIVTHSHFLKGCFYRYIPDLTFETKTVNAGISLLQFNETFENTKTMLLIN